MKKIVLFMLFILLPVTVSAKYVKWVDENGVTHFSESYADVPEKYLESMSEKAADNQAAKPDTTAAVKEVNPFILKGRIVDTNNRIKTALTGEGQKSSGKLTDKEFENVYITAWENNTKITTVHPHDDLAFEFFSDKVISLLTIVVSGYGICYRQEGPWRRDADIAIDLNRGLFAITGFVKNGDGTPAENVLVTAYDKTNIQVSFCKTGSQGQFTFLTNQPIYMLRSLANQVQMKKTGPWKENASVIMTESE